MSLVHTKLLPLNSRYGVSVAGTIVVFYDCFFMFLYVSLCFFMCIVIDLVSSSNSHIKDNSLFRNGGDVFAKLPRKNMYPLNARENARALFPESRK